MLASHHAGRGWPGGPSSTRIPHGLLHGPDVPPITHKEFPLLLKGWVAVGVSNKWVRFQPVRGRSALRLGVRVASDRARHRFERRRRASWSKLTVQFPRCSPAGSVGCWIPLKFSRASGRDSFVQSRVAASREADATHSTTQSDLVRHFPDHPITVSYPDAHAPCGTRHRLERGAPRTFPVRLTEHYC
jgi:hypothetical protein